MKIMMKLTALLLALIMALCVLVSCGDKEDDKAIETQTSGETAGIELGIAKENNEGKAIKILYTKDLADMDVSEDYSNDRVSTAMFTRDINVKEYLGINIEYYIEDGSWAQRNEFNQKIQASAQAGADYDYDMVLAYSSCSLINNASMGCYKNMYDYDDIFDFEQDWWLESLSDYAINGKLYNVYGDASLSIYTQMAVIFFNQEIVNNYNVKSPYELVKDNEWTYEKMTQLALGVSENLDDNADISLEKDLVGYLQYNVSARGWLTALEIDLINRSADDTMTIAQTPSEKLIDVYNYFYDLFTFNTNCYSGDWEEVCQCFVDGRGMFLNGRLEMVERESFGAMADDWGIVPVPKYSSEQTDYRSPLGTSAGMWCIMSNSGVAELCAKTLEVMSYFTHKNAVDEYYVRTLGEQRARDPQVGAMLEIVRDTSTLTFAAVYNDAFSPNMFNLLQMDENWRSEQKVGQNVSTYWSGNYRAWRANLTKLLTDFAK